MASRDRDNPELDSFAKEVEQRFRARLCALVRREIKGRFREREDPEDLVQSTFRSFFRRTRGGFSDPVDSADVWFLLQAIARKKVLKHIEYHTAAKRDPSRELPIEWDSLPDAPALDATAPLLGDALETVVNGLTPPDSCLLRLQVHGYRIEEVLQVVLLNLVSPYPEILQLRLQGYTEWQISQRLKCGREAVRYRLRRIVQRLNALLEDNSDV